MINNYLTTRSKLLLGRKSFFFSNYCQGELDDALERLAGATRGKSPSVSGGIPMLLLSVLPPVIPRASWPSAQHAVFRPEVTFNSEPKLDKEGGSFLNSSSEDNERKVSVMQIHVTF